MQGYLCLLSMFLVFAFFISYSCFVDVGPEPGRSADDLGCGRGLGSCPPSQARGSCHSDWIDACDVTSCPSRPALIGCTLYSVHFMKAPLITARILVTCFDVTPSHPSAFHGLLKGTVS
jgi:hypothetical protein